MKIYDENGQEIVNPDLSKGWLEDNRKMTGYTPAEEAVTRLEVMEGTNGLRRLVTVTPAKPSVPMYEACQIYHPFSAEQLENMKKPPMNERVQELENKTADQQKTIDMLTNSVLDMSMTVYA